MSKNKVFVAIHGNWGTHNRVSTVDELAEDVVRESIARQLTRLRCKFVAFGAADDHVHVLFWLHPMISLTRAFRAMKSASAIELVRENDLPFRWQHGFAAFSVSRPAIPIATSYVLNQRLIHAQRRSIDRYE